MTPSLLLALATTASLVISPANAVEAPAPNAKKAAPTVKKAVPKVKKAAPLAPGSAIHAAKPNHLHLNAIDEIIADLKSESQPGSARRPVTKLAQAVKPGGEPALKSKQVVADETKIAKPAPMQGAPKRSEALPETRTLQLDVRRVLEQPIAPKPKHVEASPSGRPPSHIENMERPKQYVVLSFDGSRSIQMWKETRALAQQQNIGITVFMSGVHFLPATLLKKYYDPPGDKYGPGTSAIRKISDADAGTIPLRMEQVEGAVGEGIEVGSHAVGHFDAGHGAGGLNWSTTDWVSELTQFQNILLNIFQLNSLPERYPGEARTWKDMVGDQLKGFRAPLLSTNGTLAPALEQLGYRYDGSEAYPMEWNKYPFKKKDANVWEIPMAQIPIAGTAKTQVGMDYNFYAFDSKATPDLDNSAFYQERWFQSLMNYFRHSYYGNRAPVHVGAHFDDYNGRAYFTGFFRFAKAICHLPEVQCVTGSELVRKMQSLGPDRISLLQHGKFTKLPTPAGLPDIKTLDLKIQWKNTNGKVIVTASGRDAAKAGKEIHVHLVVNDKLVATRLGEVPLPTETAIQQISVRLFKDGTEVLSSTRRADVRAGLVHDIEFSDREERLKRGDLPGAHGLPDNSGLLPKG